MRGGTIEDEIRRPRLTEVDHYALIRDLTELQETLNKLALIGDRLIADLLKEAKVTTSPLPYPEGYDCREKDH